MKPIEPFRLANSNRPRRNVQGEFVQLSIAVGAHTIDELHEQLGIPIPELKKSLRLLVKAGLLKQCALGYYLKQMVFVRSGDGNDLEFGF